MKILEEYDKSKDASAYNTKKDKKSKSSALDESNLYSINDMIELGMEYIQDKIYIIRNCQPQPSTLQGNLKYV